MNKKKIVIASDGTKTHIFIDGAVYGDRITEFEFLCRGWDGKDSNRKVGESDTHIRVKADTLPINGDTSEEKVIEFKNFISHLMGDTPSDKNAQGT